MTMFLQVINYAFALAVVIFAVLIYFSARHVVREMQEREKYFAQLRKDTAGANERHRFHNKIQRWRSQEALQTRVNHMHRETITRLWERDNGEWDWRGCGKPPGECTCIFVDEAPEFQPKDTDIFL